MSAVLASPAVDRGPTRIRPVRDCSAPVRAVPAACTPTSTRASSVLERVPSSRDVTPGAQRRWSPTPRSAISSKRRSFTLRHGRTLVTARRDREAMSELRRAIYLGALRGRAASAARRLYQRGGRLSEAIDEFKVAIWSRETAAARAGSRRRAPRRRRPRRRRRRKPIARWFSRRVRRMRATLIRRIGG